MLTFALLYSERDNFEAEIKDLTRKFETLDVTHTAVGKERNTLNKEVTLSCRGRVYRSGLFPGIFFSCPAGGDIATVCDSLAEGQGVSSQAKHGAQCPLSSGGRASAEATGLINRSLFNGTH